MRRDQASEKRRMNEAYADRYPRRDRQAKKLARSARVARREADWCARNLT